MPVSELEPEQAPPELGHDGEFPIRDLKFGGLERPPSRGIPALLAKIGTAIIVIWSIMTLLGIIPGGLPQEELPDKDPVEYHWGVQSYSPAETVTGPVVIPQSQ